MIKPMTPTRIIQSQTQVQKRPSCQPWLQKRIKYNENVNDDNNKKNISQDSYRNGENPNETKGEEQSGFNVGRERRLCRVVNE